MINKTETPTTTKSNIIKEKKQKKKDKRAKDTPKAADDNTVKIENTPKAEDENAIKDSSLNGSLERLENDQQHDR